MLGDPEDTISKYFPAEYANIDRPDGVKGLAWANHRFGVHVLVMELHAIATGKPLLPMVLSWVHKTWKVPSATTGAARRSQRRTPSKSK